MNALPPIPLAGVIGHPIAHSRSPALHNYWLRRYGLKGHYVPIDIAPKDLAELVRVLPRLGFVGLNVTIPHKEAILALADTVTERASQIGAANTLVFAKDGSIQADNTDGIGFIENLRQNAPQWNPASGPAVVLGAGGAARAVVAALIEAGATGVQIANRTRERAEAIRDDFGATVHVHDWDQAESLLGKAATVINTTSLGMTGKPELLLPLQGLNPKAVVTDLVYTPLKTDFLIKAATRGAHMVDGLGMLLHQAAPGFERWFGIKPEVDEITRQTVLSA